jgi:hypothetical protein
VCAGPWIYQWRERIFINQSNTLHSFQADENRWAEQVAGRLRLIQATYADEPGETRQAYLTEELRSQLGEVSMGKRQTYLDALNERFPSWQRAAEGAPAAPREPESVDELLQAMVRIAPRMTAEERQKCRDTMVELGLVEAPDAGSAEGYTALRKHLILAPGEAIVATRLEKLIIQQMEFLVKLDQLVWTTWKTLAPKSTVKRDTALGDMRNLVRRYLKGDNEVPDLLVAQQIERTRQLVAIMMGSISQVGRAFTKRYLTRYSPDAVRDLVKMEGGGSVLTGTETKCWRKYAALTEEITEASIQADMQEIIVKYTEDVIRGTPKTQA